jgi:hypothetical protein
LYLFNVERDYFECHEVMEELWLTEGRSPFYQGLLQVAVALYHFRAGNISGAGKLFAAAVEKLEASLPLDAGIDIAALIADSRKVLRRLKSAEQEPFAFDDLTIQIVDPDLAAQVKAAGH